jgi:hypothetical protein
MTVVLSVNRYLRHIRVMITAQHKTTREKLFLVCTAIQQSLIYDFKKRIASLLESGSLGNEDEYDNGELSQSTQRANEISGLNEQLDFAIAEMKTLAQLKNNPDTSDQVKPGSVVVTNIGKFFVSASIEQFDLDGEKFVGISNKSPVYLAMREKRKGEKFSYNGKTGNILDIY